jgi:septal ring factor EnvC (AmiA/AmiB activator)
MEGELKDIVLARLERRLKDKDEEIRSLRERIHKMDSEEPNNIKALEARVSHLEGELTETQIALSETLRKLGNLETLIVQLLEKASEDEDDVELADPDLALDGQKDPQELELYDKYVAAKTDPVGLMREIEKEEKGSSGDALSFFKVSRNT